MKYAKKWLQRSVVVQGNKKDWILRVYLSKLEWGFYVYVCMYIYSEDPTTSTHRRCRDKYGIIMRLSLLVCWSEGSQPRRFVLRYVSVCARERRSPIRMILVSSSLLLSLLLWMLFVDVLLCWCDLSSQYFAPLSFDPFPKLRLIHRAEQNTSQRDVPHPECCWLTTQRTPKQTKRKICFFTPMNDVCNTIGIEAYIQ